MPVPKKNGRRWGVVALAIVTVMVAFLFFSDNLTGRDYRVYQDPYSRMRRITDTRFSIFTEKIEPTVMSAYYHDTLRQPKENRWVSSPGSYRVERFTGRYIQDKSELAPVMYLEPEKELVFLQALPDNTTRIDVIRSLYTPRRAGTSPETKAANAHLNAMELTRVGRIQSWYEFDRINLSRSFAEWWRENSYVFGIGGDKGGTKPKQEASRATLIRRP